MSESEQLRMRRYIIRRIHKIGEGASRKASAALLWKYPSGLRIQATDPHAMAPTYYQLREKDSILLFLFLHRSRFGPANPDFKRIATRWITHRPQRRPMNVVCGTSQSAFQKIQFSCIAAPESLVLARGSAFPLWGDKAARNPCRR